MVPLGAVLAAFALWLAPTGSIRGTVLDTANGTGVGRVSFTWDRKRLTLFLEAINVANRRNARSALPVVNRQTLVVTGLYETMVPLIPAVGVLLEF